VLTTRPCLLRWPPRTGRASTPLRLAGRVRRLPGCPPRRRRARPGHPDWPAVAPATGLATHRRDGPGGNRAHPAQRRGGQDRARRDALRGTAREAGERGAPRRPRRVRHDGRGLRGSLAEAVGTPLPRVGRGHRARIAALPRDDVRAPRCRPLRQSTAAQRHDHGRSRHCPGGGSESIVASRCPSYATARYPRVHWPRGGLRALLSTVEAGRRTAGRC